MIAAVDAGGLDLLVLDGEAQPTGGLGLAKQVKDEIADCPPTLVLIARRDDRWLAEWSLADAVVPLPVDPPRDDGGGRRDAPPPGTPPCRCAAPSEGDAWCCPGRTCSPRCSGTRT